MSTTETTTKTVSICSKTNTMRNPLAFRRLHAPIIQQRSSFSVVPPWVIVMYNTIFFNNCVSHAKEKKNELDRFCIDCLQSFCSHCLPSHAIHKHIKIRRYIYSDVINRQNLCKLFNCSSIQTYHTNKAKVLFLKQRTQSHQQQQRSNSRDYRCSICDKGLQDNTSLYCSIACKVLDIYRDEEREDISNHKLLCCLELEHEDEDKHEHEHEHEHEDISNHKLLRCLELEHEDEDKHEHEHEHEYEHEDGEEIHVRLPLAKKQRLRQTRKGVPLRSPMF